MFRMLSPSWYKRLGGIRPSTPPSWKQPAVLAAVHGELEDGSLIRLMSAPVLSVLCEKSPWRSSSVGTRNRLTAPLVVRGENCSEKKKNRLFFPPALPTGPPNVNPQSRCFTTGLAIPFCTFAQSFVFQSELRSMS